MRVFALLMETIWTWKFCVAIYLAKSQGEEIMCNLALISSRKKTLKWLLIYHCAHPPPLPPWFNWLCNTELFVSSLDCWKWNHLRWRESFKLSGLLWKDIIRKTYRKWLKTLPSAKTLANHPNLVMTHQVFLLVWLLGESAYVGSLTNSNYLRVKILFVTLSLNGLQEYLLQRLWKLKWPDHLFLAQIVILAK